MVRALQTLTVVAIYVVVSDSHGRRLRSYFSTLGSRLHLGPSFLVSFYKHYPTSHQYIYSIRVNYVHLFTTAIFYCMGIGEIFFRRDDKHSTCTRTVRLNRHNYEPLPVCYFFLLRVCWVGMLTPVVWTSGLCVACTIVAWSNYRCCWCGQSIKCSLPEYLISWSKEVAVPIDTGKIQEFPGALFSLQRNNRW